jgi:hypothetical protein
MNEIRFQYLDSIQIKEFSLTLPYSSSWKILFKSLKEILLDLSSSPYLSLLDGENTVCHDDIHDSYTFWRLYDTIYTQEEGAIFRISNDRIVIIRFFLSFDLNSPCKIEILVNSTWKTILQLLSTKFPNFNPDYVEKVSLLESSNPEAEARDTKSFWSLFWKHWSEKSKITMVAHTSRCYMIHCQWENSPNVEGMAMIPEDCSFAEAGSTLLAALRLVSTERLTKVQVVDGENDPIGVDCANTNLLIRRYTKHRELDPKVKVLVSTKTINHHFSSPTFDLRAAQLDQNSLDYLGKLEFILFPDLRQGMFEFVSHQTNNQMLSLSAISEEIFNSQKLFKHL